MASHHQEIGVCGLSCRLCPRFHTDGDSRCTGCKGEQRRAAGCPFHTCALKKKGIAFCWDCDAGDACERWASHRAFARTHDTFVCYAALDANIARVREAGLEAFVAEQVEREALLVAMLAEFNVGRSKSFYCVAATLLTPAELRAALASARESSRALAPRDRAKALRALLEAAAKARGVTLALRP